MRITNGIIQSNMMASLNNNMVSLDKLMTQMNTLKKIERPSDDPIIAGRGMKLRINVMESEQHASNVDEATAWMEVTETALGNMTEIIKSMRDRCTQAANGGTLTTEDREKLMADVSQLYEQLKQESNVTYAGRYVFSGFKTDQPVYLDKPHTLKEDVTLSQDLELSGEMTIKGPTTIETDIKDAEGNILVPAGTSIDENGVATPPTGEEITYPIPEGTKLQKGTTLPKGSEMPAGMLNPEVLESVGDQNINYEIGINNTIGVNTTGVPKFMQDLMGDMKELMSALEGASANPPTVTEDKLNEMFTGMIGEMDEHLGSVSKMTSELGSKQKRLEFTQSRLEEDKVSLTKLLSDTEDVDIEELYVDFNTQYMVYQSALQATSKVVMNTLADFLR